MSRGIAFLLLMVVIAALSTTTYGEIYKSLGKASCVARPGQRCMTRQDDLGRRRHRGPMIRCDCTTGFSCQYSPDDNGYICDVDRFIDPDIRKIFF